MDSGLVLSALDSYWEETGDEWDFCLQQLEA